jgi:hypothetical protein
VATEKTFGASERPERRSQTIVGKILRVEYTIEQEIESNGGAYPYNDGTLTEPEVCRRAGVPPATLLGPAHATTTRLQLGTWLRKMSEWLLRGGERPDDMGTRTDEWKELLEQIAISYDSANEEVDTLRKRVKALKEREDALARKHASLNATFSRRKERGTPG